jgi:hypothetical protein
VHRVAQPQVRLVHEAARRVGSLRLGHLLNKARYTIR